MSNDKILEQKVCLVTGAGKGIGKAIAERFAASGGIVYANSRTEGALDEWASALSEKHNTQVIPIYFDITNDSATKQVIVRIKKEQGRLDVLVNNAGLVSYEYLSMIDFDQLRQMFEVNVIATIKLIQLASKLMRRQKSGSIINISSVVGDKGVSGQLGYSATKGAVIALTKSAAKELAHLNIRVNAVAPGMVGTERLKEVFEEKFQDRLKDVGLGRLAEPEEIADACLYLGSDLSTYVTGQVLTVDGITNF
jgi:3-oxoacyl-[acyl-carrier protein] reductase